LDLLFFFFIFSVSFFVSERRFFVFLPMLEKDIREVEVLDRCFLMLERRLFMLLWNLEGDMRDEGNG